MHINLSSGQDKLTVTAASKEEKDEWAEEIGYDHKFSRTHIVLLPFGLPSLSLSLSSFLLSPPNDNKKKKNRNVLPHARALLARTNKEQKAPGVGMLIIVITPPPPPSSYDNFKRSLSLSLSHETFSFIHCWSY